MVLLFMLFVYCEAPKSFWQQKQYLRKKLGKKLIPDRKIKISMPKNCVFSEKRLKKEIKKHYMFSMKDDKGFDFTPQEGIPTQTYAENCAALNISAEFLNNGISHEAYFLGNHLYIRIKGPQKALTWDFCPKIKEQMESNYYLVLLAKPPNGRVNVNLINNLRSYFGNQGQDLRFLRTDYGIGDNRNYKVFLENNIIKKIHSLGYRTPGIKSWSIPNALLQYVMGGQAVFDLNQKNIKKASDRVLMQARENGYLFAKITNIMVKKTPNGEGNDVEVYINIDQGPRFDVIGQEIQFDPQIPEEIRKKARRIIKTRLFLDPNCSESDFERPLGKYGLNCYGISYKPAGKGKAIRKVFIGYKNNIIITEARVISNRINTTQTKEIMKKWGIIPGSTKTNPDVLRRFINAFGIAAGDKAFNPEMDSQGCLEMRLNDGKEHLKAGVDPWQQLVDFSNEGAAMILWKRSNFLMNNELQHKWYSITGQIKAGVFNDMSNFFNHIGLDFKRKKERYSKWGKSTTEFNYGFYPLSLLGKIKKYKDTGKWMYQSCKIVKKLQDETLAKINNTEDKPLDPSANDAFKTSCNAELKQMKESEQSFREIRKNDILRELFQFNFNWSKSLEWGSGNLSANFEFNSNQKDRFTGYHDTIEELVPTVDSPSICPKNRQVLVDMIDVYGSRLTKAFFKRKLMIDKPKLYDEMRNYEEGLQADQGKAPILYKPKSPYFYPGFHLKFGASHDLVKTTNVHIDFNYNLKAKLNDFMAGDRTPRVKSDIKFEATKGSEDVFSALILEGQHAFNPFKKTDHVSLNGVAGDVVGSSGGKNITMELSDLRIKSSAVMKLVKIIPIAMLLEKFVTLEILGTIQGVGVTTVDAHYSNLGAYFGFSINLMGGARLVFYVYLDIYGNLSFNFFFHPISQRLAQKSTRLFSTM